MKRSTLECLACPSCRGAYRLHSDESRDGETVLGHLGCPTCGMFIPVIHGFPLFTEARFHAGQVSREALTDLERALFATPTVYEAYRRQKDERNLWEAYAAFQPFNESSRAAAPLLPTLAAHLRPGDVILDVWGRTGWSGEWLAGLFPDHRVISLWEGDSSVLGYRGFHYWLGQGRRAPNLDILFVPPNRPLPFRDGAFGVIYALDCLHRYDVYPFAGECLRAARPDAALLFAHLHLSNSEPDPFFQRGCRQIHGADYRAWLDGLLDGDGREGWVFSEADLFAMQPGDRLTDAPDTPHYNGAVLIADPARTLVEMPPPPPLAPDSRLLVNPLLRLRPARGDLVVDRALHAGEVARLLERHPVYDQRLPTGPLALTETDWVVLGLAITGRPLSRIAEALGIPPETLAPRVDRLTRAEVLRPVALSAAAHDLQRFHANQSSPTRGDRLLAQRLEALATDVAPALRLPDGAELTGQDLAGAITAARAVLGQAGLAPGDTLDLQPTDGALAFILLLAALASGLEVRLGAQRTTAGVFTILSGETATATPPKALTLGAVAERIDGLLDAGLAPTPAQPGGAITLPVEGRPCRLDAALLMEAAAALRHVTGPDRCPESGFGAPGGLLYVLIALLRPEAVAFSGPGDGTRA